MLGFFTTRFCSELVKLQITKAIEEYNYYSFPSFQQVMIYTLMNLINLIIKILT